MLYLDPLYGRLEFSDKQLALFQTPALTRIRDVSLSAVPPLATASGMIGSRFEHSVGVAHLASLLATKSDFQVQATNLFVACLFHDIGSPPFSHISEILLEKISGQDHEAFAATFFENSETATAIKNFGADLDMVLKLITGKAKPWSDLVNGSIDLDNIDNSLRWGSAIGLFSPQFYEPEELIQAFSLSGNELQLKLEHESQIQKWELCRRLVYDVVYDDLNLTPEVMLKRALQFAYEAGELDQAFFMLTDSQALYVLEHRCNSKTQNLIKDMRAWRFFTPVTLIEETDTTASDTFKDLCLDWEESQKIADIIAHSLDLPREAVAVYAGKDKGFKQIHLPFIGKGDIVQRHQPIQELKWRFKVYVDKKYHSKNEAITELTQALVQNP
ncbi:HD domain-containing protein [Candidatus Beckwithbacteria bacterium]|nr:HD domain-containing protein [Candidatus Beckwithbacteria bacterium]